MTSISENMLNIGGFLLAHATFVIGDLDPTDSYVPEALCLKDGEIVLNVFEANTQVEAVSKGKAFMETEAVNFEACAFARDGLVRKDGSAIDVLLIDLSDDSGAHVLTMIQPYKKDEQLHLLGDEVFLSSDGASIDEATSAAMRPFVHDGAQSHSGAPESWNGLNNSRQPSPDLF
jgi:hypothetical protein